MSWIQRRVFCLCIFAMAVVGAATLVTPACAQDRNIRSVTFYTVKPDRIGDFRAEVKEYNAILAKAGSDGYSSVWVGITGAHEFARVQMYSKWADLDASIDSDPKLKDQAADLARVSMRIIDCTESWHRDIEMVVPELSLPESGAPPKMIRVLVTQVRPDKYQEYLDFVKNVIFPAVKKGGTRDYSVAEGSLGESGMEVTSVTGFNSWADLDAGIGAQKGLSKEDYHALVDKVRALITQSEFDIYRYESDESYLPPPTAK
jgi:quinol monooxygenase YgiN